MNNEKLTILWTSGEKDVALKVVLRYIDNLLEKQVWSELELIIWGPSVQLAGDDEMVKLKLENLLTKGLKAKACIVCADEYGVSQNLESVGIVLEMVADELTRLIQDQRPLISF